MMPDIYNLQSLTSVYGPLKCPNLRVWTSLFIIVCLILKVESVSKRSDWPETKNARIERGKDSVVQIDHYVEEKKEGRNKDNVYHHKTRERQLLNIIEVIISTLEEKLKGIDRIDNHADHILKRLDSLENKVEENISKTNLLLLQLQSSQTKHEMYPPISRIKSGTNIQPLNEKLYQNDYPFGKYDSDPGGIGYRPVTEQLANQISNNGSMHNGNISTKDARRMPSYNCSSNTEKRNKNLNNTDSLNLLQESTENINKKLHFYTNIMSENVGTMMESLNEIRQSLLYCHPKNWRVEPNLNGSGCHFRWDIDVLSDIRLQNVTLPESLKKTCDTSSVKNLPNDALLSNLKDQFSKVQRQERAISDIYEDLNNKTNYLKNESATEQNESRLHIETFKSFAQDPLQVVPSSDYLRDNINVYPVIRNDSDVILQNLKINEEIVKGSSTLIPQYEIIPSITEDNKQMIFSGLISSFKVTTNGSFLKQPLLDIDKPSSKKTGIIFPSIKNKPAATNFTFPLDILALKDVQGYSCVDLLNAGMKTSGIYYLQIRGTAFWFLKAFCEQISADGGWTIIQRRDDFGEPRENFNRDWSDYKNGFGDLAKEFWLGNENIYMLTNNDDYMLRIELEDFDGNKRYAQYSEFRIYSESEYYKLELNGYEGDAGDSLNDPWYGANNSPFSTYNKDNDRSSLNCASMLKGGWWWKSCGRGLNGLYLHDPKDLTARQGIVWFRWRGWDYTLKKSVMMIKPRAVQTK